MSPSTRFRVTPGITHQLIEGEVIVLDLDTGAYYSLDGSAALIWESAQGHTTDGIVRALQTHFDGEPDTIRAEVCRLLDELCTAKLLLHVENETGNGAGDAEPGEADATKTPLAPAPSTKTPFAAPALHKYTDMTDLLLLDPIHEVDEAGWPHAADPTATATHPA